ncbi:protein SpAN isoform X1 [Hydra vulgaris]|uniref:protein SpAN isoform X1 n=1 Tax=Hydra vulgaris TaxID=6087 RepID=UPI001F5E50B8|nr:protein SpAN isoform X1 [Hydra vulgaris]
MVIYFELVLTASIFCYVGAIPIKENFKDIENVNKPLVKDIAKVTTEEYGDEIIKYIKQMVDNVVKKTINHEINEIKSIKKDDKSISDDDKDKILMLTEETEKLGETARGIHFENAVEVFEKKMKLMEPKDITNPETFVEKQLQALVEQKAEDVNKRIDIIEGDIIRTKELNDVISNQKRNLYNGVKWGLLIPYQLPVKIEGDGKMERAINEAMREISSVSCIRFIKRKNDGSSDDNVGVNGLPESYLNFIQGKGCYSPVGNQENGGQDISIDLDCSYKGTVMHEILHALGFYHEQSRLDRDDYVKINFENVIEKMADNFKKYEVGTADTQGFNYDLASIMHYGDNYFSKNGLKTIEVIGRKDITIGQREFLSDSDKQKLNKFYCTDYQEEYNKKNLSRMKDNIYAAY